MPYYPEKSKQLRICLVGGGLMGGGQERSLTNLANYFDAIGYDIIILNLFRTEQFYPLNRSVVIRWPELDRNRNNRVIYALRIIPYIRNCIRKFKPDVIISFGEWFNPFVVLSTRLIDVPVYLYDLMGPMMKLDPLIQLSRRFLYRFADGVIVQTTKAGEIVHALTGVRRIKVIPNPLNPVNTEVRVRVKKIISLGRLSEEKGHVHLIRAFSRLHLIDWSLEIVGDGPEMLHLQNETEKLQISDRVKFHGQLKDFASLLGESEIFVLPSLHEGFPNALLEAMSVPLACISSDCVAGPGEIIQPGVNGLLVKPGDETELAEAIELLILNPDLRRNLAQEAYKVREKYNFDTIAREFLSFILPEKSN